MWFWVELIGTTVFGGEESIWFKSNELHGKSYAEIFNSRSEYYCENVRIGERRTHSGRW